MNFLNNVYNKNRFFFCLGNPGEQKYLIIAFTVQILQHCKPKLKLPINSDLLHNLNGGENANLKKSSVESSA